MVGEALLDAVDDELLAMPVGVGDQLGRILQGGLDVVHFLHRALTREPGGDNGCLENLA